MKERKVGSSTNACAPNCQEGGSPLASPIPNPRPASDKKVARSPTPTSGLDSELVLGSLVSAGQAGELLQLNRGANPLN